MVDLAISSRNSAARTRHSGRRHVAGMLAVVAIVSAVCAALFAAPTVAQASAKKLPGPGDRAMWVWGGITFSSQASITSFLDFVNAPHGYPGLSINRILLACGSKYLSGSSATQMRSFIQQAHARGVLVEYLDGDAQWTTSASLASTPKNLVSQVIAFNKGTADVTDDFDGIHLDIEPHVLGALWTSNSAGGTDKYNNLLEDNMLAIYRACKQLIVAGDPKMTLAADIGVWYVSAATDIWNGFMNDQSVDYLGIMDYTDNQPTYQTQALANLKAVKGNIKIMVGVESIDPNSAPDEQSFYQEGYGPLEAQLLKTSTALKAYSSWGGYAIHHYGSYSTLGYWLQGAAPAIPAAWKSPRPDYPSYGTSTGTTTKSTTTKTSTSTSTSKSTSTSTSTSTKTRTSTSTSTSKPTGGSTGTGVITTGKKMPGQGDRAMWVWGGITYSSQASITSFLDFVNAPHGYPGLSINRILLSCGTKYLSGTGATQMRSFIQQAHARGVLVEYLDGDAQWTTSAALAATPKNVVSQVIAFNKGTSDATDDFDGIHLDIEPHVLGALWTSNSAGGTDQYNNMLEDNMLAIYRACKQLIAEGDPKMTLAADIGVWYVTSATDIWNGFMKDQSVDYLGIMDYTDQQLPFQNKAIQNLKAVKGNIKIMVGVESIDENSAPDAQSFWQEGYGPLEAQLATSSTALKAYSAWGGYAIHHYASYSVLGYNLKGAAPAIPAAWKKPRADYPNYGSVTVPGEEEEEEVVVPKPSKSATPPVNTDCVCRPNRREATDEEDMAVNYAAEDAHSKSGSNTQLMVVAALGWGVASVGILNMLVTERRRRAENAAALAANM
ncbi:hypothetical protein CAOG_03135 [Capsaspora owczarzaki ATCC 30864]|uniref:Uncharacterized protein n=1 Tax=Capsaspora owczarzaki (strain ATCC 30864) TaxID=595528 RepID=A0A0D2WNU1_CAPO3|nr:hypothetical protein CAOG_03135 [Capsaspora owczarzaki ATCC 30864]KJE92113.1 hypothetical protein CAOG_003135 [Capsaspora owczarzaki ATCC 30864]|eukprot:XP_004363974.1 hypothetical protein CAOG_03135 [Capsaspora owczarzaki ATCC 30864]